MTVSGRVEDLRDVGWQVDATLPVARENGDALIDGVDRAAVVDGDTLTGYVWFGGWQQIWQVSRVTEGVLAGVAEAVAALSGTAQDSRTGTLGAVAEAVAALSGTVASPGPTGTLAAQAEAVAAITGKVVVSGQFGATAEAVGALSGTVGSDFDPLADIAWHMASWADDPNWTNPGDGNAVSQWDDGTGNGRHLTQATGSLQPTFNESNANFNNRATLDFNGDRLATASWTTLTQPTTIVIVGKVNTTSAGALCDGIDGTDRQVLYGPISSSWTMFAGSNSTGNLHDTNTNVHVCIFDGVDSVHRENGTPDDTSPGAAALSGLTVGSFHNGSTAMVGSEAWASVFDGVLPAGDIDDFETWAIDYYDL